VTRGGGWRRAWRMSLGSGFARPGMGRAGSLKRMPLQPPAEGRKLLLVGFDVGGGEQEPGRSRAGPGSTGSSSQTCANEVSPSARACRLLSRTASCAEHVNCTIVHWWCLAFLSSPRALAHSAWCPASSSDASLGTRALGRSPPPRTNVSPQPSLDEKRAADPRARGRPGGCGGGRGLRPAPSTGHPALPQQERGLKEEHGHGRRCQPRGGRICREGRAGPARWVRIAGRGDGAWG
jgi:hypothetical protein